MQHILEEIYDNALYEFYNNDLLNSKKHFEIILEIDEDYAQAYWYLGRICEEQNDSSLAADYFSKYITYGIGELKGGDYLIATEIFTDMILMHPTTPEFYGYRALSYKEWGKMERSQQDWNTKSSLSNDIRTRDIYLFIDTETTGLPNNWQAPMTDLHNWPRIVQLAWILSDDEGNIIHDEDYIIKPEGFTIPKESSRVHKITQERALNEGNDLNDVLFRLSDTTKYLDYVVGHNVSFDFNIIGAEFIRQKINNPLLSRTQICTMKSTVDICKINSRYGYKWPTLNELHMKIFNKEIQEVHDASKDVLLTFKCFWQLRKNKLI